MTHLQNQSLKIICAVNKKLLWQQRAVNVIEHQNGLNSITITSAITEIDGLELDPKTGSETEIHVFFGCGVKKYKCILMEKKISGSVDKNSYQLLTYTISDELPITKVHASVSDKIKMAAESLSHNLDSTGFEKYLRGHTIDADIMATIICRFGFNPNVIRAAELCWHV